MEGYLNKYINIVLRWKPRYFILKNGILTYCDFKGEAPKGTIHLKISEIDLTPEDPLKIIINSGTKTLSLRANTIGDKIKWVNALRSSKEEIQRKDSEYNKLKANFNSSTLKDFFQKYDDSSEQFDQTPQTQKFNDLNQLITSKINEIWADQLRFDDTLQVLMKKLGPNSSVNELLMTLQTLGGSLLKQMTNLTKLLESEKRNMSRMLRKIDHKLDKMEGIRMNVNDGKSLIMSQEDLNKFEGNPFQETSSVGKESKLESKLSLKSEDILMTTPPEFTNQPSQDYVSKSSKALSAIKEEDSPAKLRSYDDDLKLTAELKKAPSQNYGSFDNLPKANEQTPESKPKTKEVRFNEETKIRELQQSLSHSLNKIRMEDPFNSKIENTVFESFEHQTPSPGRDKEEHFGENMLRDMNVNTNNDDSSSDTPVSPLEYPDSPIAILKNCSAVKKVQFLLYYSGIFMEKSDF